MTPSATIRNILVFCFTIAASGMLGNYYKATLVRQHLDSAFLMEIAESTRLKGQPDSWALRTSLDGYKTWSLPADTVCSSDLNPVGQPYNALDNHAYYAIYPISYLTYFFSGKTVISYLNGFAFVLLLVTTYLFLRHKMASIHAVIFFCLLVCMHPAWSFSALGDFYMDRFYMPFALAYLFGLHLVSNDPKLSSKPWVWISILTSAIIAAAMTERAAIMIGCATFALLFLYWRHPGLTTRARVAFILLGALLLFYAKWYLSNRFIGTGGGAGGLDILGNLSHVLNRFSLPHYKTGLIIFFVINIGMLGFFSLFAGWLISLLCISTLLPNIIVTVGGAELAGWSTHYHSMYFPFLIFCAALGYLKFTGLLADRNLRNLMMAPLLVFPLLLNLTYNPYSGSFYAPSKANFHTGVLYGVWQFYTNQSTALNFKEMTDKFNAAIPPGSKVSTVEGAMPMLFQNRRIYYYPIGAPVANYVVAGIGTDESGKKYVAGAINYISSNEALKLDKCITKRLIDLGYDLENPQMVGNAAIIKRKAQP